MGDYLRTTRECTFDNMRPEWAAAIRAHLEKLSFDEGELPAAACFETISTKQKKGIFHRKPEVIVTAILLTPKWLIWAAGKEDERPGVLSANLSDIQVEEYEKSTMVNLVQDSGINILNVPTAAGFGTVFIGLGPESASQKFRTALREAIKNA